MSEKKYRCKAEVDADDSIQSEASASQSKVNYTFKQRAANFWYYYKWHTIIGLFIAAVLAFGCVQCATKENPDYTVIMAFDKTVPSGVTDSIETYLEQYGEDINGDGKTVVHIYDVSSSQDKDIQEAQSTKLIAEMQRGEAMLFIVDDVYFDKLYDLDVFEKNSDYFPDKDGYAINLRNTSFQTLINSVHKNFISNNFYLAKRVVKGTDFESKKTSIKAEQDNIKLMHKFLDSIENDK